MATGLDFERLSAEHKDAVYRQLLRMCGNHDDAEDVLVQALVNAFQAQESLRDEEAFRSWLVQIGRRACFRLKRRDAHRPIVGFDELLRLGIEIADPHDLVHLAEEEALKDCVSRALERLAPKYRETYERVELEGQSLQEAADAQQISVAALKSRLHRAREHVRAHLDRALFDPEASPGYPSAE